MAVARDETNRVRDVRTDEYGRVLTISTNAAGDPVGDPGTKVTAVAALGAGGAGQIGWLSQIADYLLNRLPASLGTKTAAASLSVTPASDALFSVGATATPSASFARPADTTAYAIGDLVTNSTTAGSVTPLQFTIARVAAGAFSIIKARLRKSGTGVTGVAAKLHLFSVQPTVTNGDNGVFLPNQATSWLGSIDFSSMQAFSDGAVGNGTPSTGSAITAKLDAGQIIYGLLESRGAWTPANGETFTIILEALQD